MNFESKQQSLLTFRVGPVLCCAPSLPVRSIITPPKLTHTPGSDASQPGIFKHASHIVKVLNLRKKFGIEQSEQTQPGNFIITIFEKESFAFWVDQILDVFDFPSEGWGNLPAAIPRGVFSRTLLLNKKIHLYCEFANLATINDLGYLKHYIQQLKQQTQKQTSADIPDVSNTANIKNTSDEKPTIKPAIKTETEEKEHKQSSSINNIEAAKSNKNNSITKSSSHDIDLKQAKKTTIKQTINKPPSIKEKIQSSATATPASKQVQHPIPHNVVHKQNKHEFEPRTNTATKITQEKIFANKTSNSTKSDLDDKTETPSIAFILFLIFILGSLATGFYYLFAEDSSRSKNYTNEIQKTKSILEVDSPVHKINNFIPNVEITETTISDNSEENLPAIEDKLIENTEYQTKTTQLDTEIQKSGNDSDTENNSLYRADITQFDNEITITIHQPVVEEEKQQTEKIIPLQPVAENIINETVLTTPPVKTLKHDELSKTIPAEKIISEVIHTVVKGDTLWAIAKKYVNDPFLYPELARLSNIKNPHRIYPGNRVRIRFIKN